MGPRIRPHWAPTRHRAILGVSDFVTGPRMKLLPEFLLLAGWSALHAAQFYCAHRSTRDSETTTRALFVSTLGSLPSLLWLLCLLLAVGLVASDAIAPPLLLAGLLLAWTVLLVLAPLGALLVLASALFPPFAAPHRAQFLARALAVPASLLALYAMSEFNPVKMV